MQKMINNLKNTNVSDGYQLGLSDRKEISFIAGSEYKIKEFRGRLERKQKVLVKIGDAVRKKEMPHCFGPCMGFEAAAWCKSLPAFVSHQLGHDFVGALKWLIFNKRETLLREKVIRYWGKKILIHQENFFLFIMEDGTRKLR